MTMDKQHPSDEQLQQLMRDAIEQRTESLDAATQSKLNQARQRALDELDTGRSRSFGTLPLAGATAAAVVIAVVIATRVDFGPQGSSAPAMAEVAADDFELLLAGDDLDMIEDYEFYEVLEVL